jgi:hypothetical protein
MNRRVAQGPCTAAAETPKVALLAAAIAAHQAGKRPPRVKSKSAGSKTS